MLKSERFNNFFDKFVYIFLLLSPVLDALTSLFIKKIDFSFSIGTVIRGIFLLLIIIWLKNNYKNKKILFLFVLYLLLAMMYYFGKYKSGVVLEVTNIFHIFYLFNIIIFFY